MNLFRVCCEPCEDAQMCCEQHSCCVECHFSFEEIHALPYVERKAPHLANQIRREHAELQRLGFPRDKVREHAEREMEIFRRYCPPQVLQQLEDDHAAYEAGTLGLQPGQENVTMHQSVAVGAAYSNPSQLIARAHGAPVAPNPPRGGTAAPTGGGRGAVAQFRGPSAQPAPRPSMPTRPASWGMRGRMPSMRSRLAELLAYARVNFPPGSPIQEVSPPPWMGEGGCILVKNINTGKWAMCCQKEEHGAITCWDVDYEPSEGKPAGASPGSVAPKPCTGAAECPPGQGCIGGVCTPWAPSAPMGVASNPRGGRGGGMRAMGGAMRSGGSAPMRRIRPIRRHHGGRGWWPGYWPYYYSWYPYYYYPYYTQQQTQGGFDCVEFDDKGNCVLLKKRGADVDLAGNPALSSAAAMPAGGSAAPGPMLSGRAVMPPTRAVPSGQVTVPQRPQQPQAPQQPLGSCPEGYLQMYCKKWAPPPGPGLPQLCLELGSRCTAPGYR